MCFIKGLANSKLNMLLKCSTYVLTISPLGNLWQNHNKQIKYERSHKLLNSYSLVEYNKIYPNINSWKILQEKSSWHGRLWLSRPKPDTRICDHDWHTNIKLKPDINKNQLNFYKSFPLSYFSFLFLYLNDITFHLTFRASILYSKY